MNILLISSYLPYPLFSGGHIRLYNLIKRLSGRHNITLICEKRDYQKTSDIEEVEKYCKKVITVPRMKQWSMKNILKTGFSFSPFLVTGHTQSLMKEKIKDNIRRSQFDLIHVETSYVMQNLPFEDLRIPVVLVEHNIEYLVYKFFANNTPLFFRPFFYLDVAKLKFWEEGMWKKATKLVAVSERDKKVMNKKRKDVDIVANGVDTKKFEVRSSKFEVNGEKRILFIGDFKWIQNRDSLREIILEIWPKLKAEIIPSLKGLKLWVVGRWIPDSLKRLTSDKSIFFDDNAPVDTSLIYQKSHILLAPIRVGGGTSYKILEAMASGIPVVTTPFGNAIDAMKNSEAIICESSKDFVQGITSLLEDKDLYMKIAINARKLVEEKFSWEKITNDLESVYENAVFGKNQYA